MFSAFPQVGMSSVSETLPAPSLTPSVFTTTLHKQPNPCLLHTTTPASGPTQEPGLLRATPAQKLFSPLPLGGETAEAFGCLSPQVGESVVAWASDQRRGQVPSHAHLRAQLGGITPDWPAQSAGSRVKGVAWDDPANVKCYGAKCTFQNNPGWELAGLSFPSSQTGVPGESSEQS